MRDLVDLVTVHETILPLGALIWAGLIAEIRRNAHYPPADWRAVIMNERIDPANISARLRRALDGAEAFVTRMPTGKMGLSTEWRGHSARSRPLG